MAPLVITDKAAVPGRKRKHVSDTKSKLEQRQFYHSQTYQPMSIDEVLSDRDSEDEVDEDMTNLEDRLRLDGVNLDKDQARFMHLWISFVKSQRVVADGHMPWACEAFSRLHKEELNMNLSLFWCLRLFLIKMWDRKLVDASTISKCNAILENRETTEIFESALVPTAPTTITENNSIPPPPLDVQATTVVSTVNINGGNDERDVGGDQSALLEQRGVVADTESSRDADTTESIQKFVRKRLVKPSLKVREMQGAKIGGRGSRGRRGGGRGARGDHGNLVN